MFEDSVVVEGNCRFVAAQNATITIGAGSAVTAYAIFNAGADITIGRPCIVGPRASINSSEHLFARGTPVREQGFVHAPIVLEDGVWLAANVVVMKGVRIREGCVIGAQAVVTADTEPYGIYVGAPARNHT